MARVFITGSADGLGQLTAKALINQGHTNFIGPLNVSCAVLPQMRKQGSEEPWINHSCFNTKRCYL